jgi:hypothetical protein
MKIEPARIVTREKPSQNPLAKSDRLFLNMLLNEKVSKPIE